MTDYLQQERLTRNQRTRILIEGNPVLCSSICAAIEREANVSLLKAPHEVLVMNKVRESAHNSLFYLGEALLTECKVVLERKGAVNEGDASGDIGIGLILGENREKAYELAVIDAAFSAAEPYLGQDEWQEMLLAEEARLLKSYELGKAKLETTRVEFKNMVVEDSKEESQR